MSKIFAVVKNGYVDNVVVADDSSLALETELWVDVTDYGDFRPSTGWMYNSENSNAKFYPILSASTLNPRFKIKLLPLSAGQTLNSGEWIYQGNDSIGLEYDATVISHDPNTNILIVANQLYEPINPELPLHTINHTFNLDPNGIVKSVTSNGVIETITVFTDLVEAPKPPKYITKSGFRFRLTNAEYAGILQASKTDAFVQVWTETFNMINSIDLESQSAKDDMAMFVSKGLLTQQRADAILNDPLQPNETVSTP